MAEGGVPHYTEWTQGSSEDQGMSMKMNPGKQAPLWISCGYGPVIRQIRRAAYKEFDRKHNSYMNSLMLCFTAGSKAEGLTCAYESDIDRIFVPHYVMCLEECIDQRTIPGQIILFNMNLQRTIAGYCRLLLWRQTPKIPTNIINSLCDDGFGNSLLSSALYLEQFEKKIQLPTRAVRHPRAGPSMPWSDGLYRSDVVHAIRCHCPVILQTWANRPRHWPPPEVVEKVVTMGAFVTPVGYKGSAYNHVEWRICFNTAETELVNNLNDTQAKLYVMLKMIVNDILKPQTKEITSYILKNIVLWLAENNPQTLFHTGSLFHWLHEGLDILRTAISTRQLPYYMIPERNLMGERNLEDKKQRVLVTQITIMMNDGPRILLRMKKLRHAIICHPEPLLWYSRMRTELEIVHLMHKNRRFQYLLLIESDTMLSTLVERMNEIGRKVQWRMRQEGSSVIDVNKVYGAMLLLSTNVFTHNYIRTTENKMKLIALF